MPDFIHHYQSKGFKVIGIDAAKDAVGRFFCDEFYQVPLAKNENINKYIEILGNINFDLFLPWVDEELLLLSNNKIPTQLTNKIVISSAESIKLCSDKIKFHEFCEGNNILVPGLKSTAPAFVRRKTSRGSRGAVKITNDSLLTNYLNNDYLVTENIDGTEYTIDALIDKEGALVFAVPRERLSTNRVSINGKIEMRRDLIDFTKRIIKKFNFIGPINIQVIKENATDKLYLIEVNPRLAGTSILSIKAGFDLIEATYDMMINNKSSFDFKINDKIKINRYLKGYFYE